MYLYVEIGEVCMVPEQYKLQEKCRDGHHDNNDGDDEEEEHEDDLRSIECSHVPGAVLSQHT